MPPRPNAEQARAARFQTGVLNVDKPEGETSFAVVNRLRKLTGAHRVGHAGTLDPLATGVLPVLFESATRLADFALQLQKTYVAEIHFGFTTATDDAEVAPEPVADPSHVTAEDVRSALAAFAGRIMQQPPAFSAVKIEGKRAYELARSGATPAPVAREVDVYEATMLDFAGGPKAVARVEIKCGRGTYLRAIARDLGQKLGVGGYLGQLERTAYGGLTIDRAVPAAQLTTREGVLELLLPAEVILPDSMERVKLNAEQEAQVRQGRPVRVLPEPAPGLVRAHDAEGRLVALGHTDPLRRTFVPEKVLS